MDNQPHVSVITIFFNAERFIEEAIESVLAQTYANWELLLVDDGSADASSGIARRFATRQPEKVRYLEHDGHKNRGMSAARNLGISHSQGKYIAFLDADDVWLPEKLERQVAILESQPKVAMVYGPTEYWYGWTGLPEDIERDRAPDLGVPGDTMFEPPTLLTLLYPLGSCSGPLPLQSLIRRLVQRKGSVVLKNSFTGFTRTRLFDKSLSR
jgi:glycosyltransferase involved in cell wall biosynthesis